MTMPGPGDPETWGAPTGHPHDPRTSDTYGPCAICDEETSRILETGVDADENGEYSYVIFRCVTCEALIAEARDEPEEVAERYRALEIKLEALARVAKQVTETWERSDLTEAVHSLEKIAKRSQGRRT